MAMLSADEKRRRKSAGKAQWRQRYPKKHAAAARRYRERQRFARLLTIAGVRETDLMPWLEQLGKARRSTWRSRARDLWDAWQMICEQQNRCCYVCKRRVALVTVVRSLARNDVVGAVCERCGSVYSMVASVPVIAISSSGDADAATDPSGKGIAKES